MSDLDLPLDLKDRNEKWVKVAKPGFNNPKKLWGEYRQRYNTITIPLQDTDAYFTDAIAAARIAENRKHFEELLAETFNKRQAELENLKNKVAHATIYEHARFRSDTARKFASRAAREMSLDIFFQLLCDQVFISTGFDNKKWPSRVDAIKDEGNESASGTAQGDAQPDDGASDISGIGSDECWEANRRGVTPDPMDFWDLDDEDAWNNPSWEIQECYDSDTEAVEPAEQKQPPAPSTSREELSLIKGGEPDDLTQTTDVGGSQTATGAVKCIPSTPPKALSSSNSAVLNDAATDRILFLESDYTLAAESAGQDTQSHASQTPETSNVTATDRPLLPITIESPSIHKKGLGDRCRSRSAEGARVEKGDDKLDGAGRDRQERRVTKSDDQPMGASMGRKRVREESSDDEVDNRHQRKRRFLDNDSLRDPTVSPTRQDFTSEVNR